MHRAECEPGSNDGDLRVTVVSKAFEGKTAKRREKLVLKAMPLFLIILWDPGPAYTLYMYAMHKHTAHISLRQPRRSTAAHSACNKSMCPSVSFILCLSHFNSAQGFS